MEPNKPLLISVVRLNCVLSGPVAKPPAHWLNCPIFSSNVIFFKREDTKRFILSSSSAARSPEGIKAQHNILHKKEFSYHFVIIYTLSIKIIEERMVHRIPTKIKIFLSTINSCFTPVPPSFGKHPQRRPVMYGRGHRSQRQISPKQLSSGQA